MPINPTTGVYTAPDNSWNPAVAGTVIDPDDWNATQLDYESALTDLNVKSRDTLAIAQTTVVPADVDAIQLLGYSAVGDGGGAFYKRVVSEPTHAGKFESADGAWWEIFEAQINPKMVGATGDGTTNDTTALNNWLDIADICDVLVGTADTYNAEGALNIVHANTRIEGRGMLISQKTATLDISILNANSINGIVVSGLRLDGQKALKTTSGTHSSYGVFFIECSNVTIEGCEVFDTVEHGVRCGGGGDDTDTNGISVRNNYIHDCGNALQGRGYAIWLFKSPDKNIITGNRCVGNISGIGVDEDSSGGGGNEWIDDTIIANNFSSAYSDALRWEGARRGSITGNVIICIDDGTTTQLGSEIAAAYFRDIQANTGTEYLTVSGNYFQGPQYAVHIYDVKGVTFTGNTVRLYNAASQVYSSRSAVELFSASAGKTNDGITISGNTIFADGPAIRVGYNTIQNTETNKNVNIGDNTVIYNGGSAAVSGDFGIGVTVFAGCKISDNVVNGFYDNIVSNSANSSGRHSITGNTSVGAVRYGAQLSGTLPRSFGNNTISGAGTADLRFESASNNQNVALSNNSVSSTSGSYNLVNQISPSVGLSGFALNLGLASVIGATVTITPTPSWPIQYYTNDAAHAIAPGSAAGLQTFKVINTTGAAIPTTAGFTYTTGDAFDATTTSVFVCQSYYDGTVSSLYVQKLA